VLRIGPWVALPLVTLPLAGCGHTAILDQSPIGNYVVLSIVNDSASSVKVTQCYGTVQLSRRNRFDPRRGAPR
jgi:hypothetical protein